MTREAFEGGEFDWFAVDGAGHIGHFATAGFGPVPASVLDRLVEARDLGGLLLALPKIGEAIGHLPGRIEDWMEMARRGLFSYDWQHWSGPYRRAATPCVPVRVAELPTRLRRAVSVVAWPGVRFAETLTLRPEELSPCE